MDTVREVCTAALGLRKAHQIRVRQPLGRVRVALPEPERAADLRDLSDLIAHEVNLKEVDVLVLDEDSYGDLGVEKRLAVNARAAGPRLGKDVQTVIRAAKAGDWGIKPGVGDRKSTRLNSSHVAISYAVFCLKKKQKDDRREALQ